MHWFVLVLQIVLLGIFAWVAYKQTGKKPMTSLNSSSENAAKEMAAIIKQFNQVTYDNVTLLEDRVAELTALLKKAEERIKELKAFDIEYARMQRLPAAAVIKKPLKKKHVYSKTETLKKYTDTPHDTNQSDNEMTIDQLTLSEISQMPHDERLSYIPTLAQQGCSNAYIADKLHISIAEVTTYLSLFPVKEVT